VPIHYLKHVLLFTNEDFTEYVIFDSVKGLSVDLYRSHKILDFIVI